MKIAIMGYGTIGSGVAEVLEVNKELIADRTGESVEIKYILDLRDFPVFPPFPRMHAGLALRGNVGSGRRGIPPGMPGDTRGRQCH